MRERYPGDGYIPYKSAEPSAIPSARAVLLAAGVFMVMVFLLFGSIWASSVVYPKAFQDPTQIPPEIAQAFAAVHPPVALPPVEVTLAEVFEILADYDVVHVSKFMSVVRFYGMTVPDSKTIFVNADPSADLRAETVIHEVIHVIYSRRGYDTRGPYEDLVEAKAQEIYAQLYGPKQETK